MDPNFFGLSGNPFAQPDSTETPCLAEEHLALTAELHAGLKAPHGITLLIGEQGTGKTSFIRNFVAQLPDSYVVAYLPTAGPGLRHLLTEIIEQLGGTVAAGGQEQALIDTVRALAKARAEHDRATLVVIDDAHELPAKTIERLSKLFGPDAADPSRLHVALVGRPELLDRMNAANDRSILKHLVQVCRMDAIGPEDAFRYIADRVQKVGGIVDHLFSEDALRLIVQRANGNPARIDQLCAASLERAEGRGIAAVDAAAVEAASNGGEVVARGEAGVADEQPETPTYFFNEDDDEQRARQGTTNVRNVPANARALPKEGAAVAVPASRQRLAYWAAGAIAVVIALALVMTGKELPLGGGDSSITGEGGEPAQTAAAGKTSRPTEDVSPDTTADPLAVPKLVVKRGARAGAGRNAETAGAGAAATADGVTAPTAPEAAPERPRFPAPPLPTAAEAPTKPVTEPAAKAATGTEPPIQTSVPPASAAAGADKAAESPTAKPVPAPTQGTPPPVAVATPAKAAPATPAPTASPPRPDVAPAAPLPPTRPAATPPAPAAAAPKPIVAAPAPTQTATAKPATAKVAAAGRYTVQLGAFSSRANAEALLARARAAASDGRIIASSAGGKSVFRVVAGSFATQSEANTHAAALKKSGYTPFVRTLD